MANTDLDWTFDDSPDDAPAVPAAPAQGGPDSAAPPRRRARKPADTVIRPTPLPRADLLRRTASKPRLIRWLRVLGVVVLVIGLAAFAVYWLGWQRVRASLTRDILYEDQQALAGNVDGVLAMQAGGDDAWRNWRAAEVRAGLASLPPAENLRPLAEPPRLLRLDVREGSRFDATVLRAFSDSAGQRYDFLYDQRYLQIAPGVWESLPPPTAELIATRNWNGMHIKATFPLADEAWMLRALPQIDTALNSACIDWICPPGSAVSVTFSGKLPVLPGPGSSLPAGAEAERAALAGGYPLIFDIAVRQPRYRTDLILPSPHVAGYPANAAATEMLRRAITANLLGQLAANLAGAGHSPRIVYLDALIARAELRLRLSTAPAVAGPPGDFVAPGQLWPGLFGGGQLKNDIGLHARLQALSFLQTVLDEQPASLEPALLRLAGGAPGLTQWLNAALNMDGEAALADWSRQLGAQLASAYPANWAQLKGLAYACSDGAWLINDGQLWQLPVQAGGSWLLPGAVSPDRRWLVTTALGGTRISLMDLALGQPAGTVPGSGWPVAWLPDSRLVTVEAPASPLFTFDQIYHFQIYDPASGAQAALGSVSLSPPDLARGLAAGGQPLVVTLINNALRDVPGERPALLALNAPLRAQTVDFNGFSPSLSPDGRWLAYVPAPDPTQIDQPWAPAHLAVFDRQLGQSLQALISEALPGEPLHDPFSLAWSPDGRRLAFIVRTGAGGTRLMRLQFARQGPGAGADLREISTVTSAAYVVGFSADNRYLAVAGPADDPAQISVMDLDTGHLVASGAIAPGLVPEFSAAWAPTGHWLALAGPAGLYVLDPASRAQQWVAGGACQPAWYDLRAAPP